MDIRTLEQTDISFQDVECFRDRLEAVDRRTGDDPFHRHRKDTNVRADVYDTACSFDGYTILEIFLLDHDLVVDQGGFSRVGLHVEREPTWEGELLKLDFHLFDCFRFHFTRP